MSNRVGTSLNEAWCATLLVAVVSWVLGVLALPYNFSLPLVALMVVALVLRFHTVIKEHIDFEISEQLHNEGPHGRQETAKWVNFLLNRWCVFSSKSIQHLIQGLLTERLKDLKPKSLKRLELKTFILGEEAPEIFDVQVSEYTEAPDGHQKESTHSKLSSPSPGLDGPLSDLLVIRCGVRANFPQFHLSFKAEMWSFPLPFRVTVHEVNVSGSIKVTVALSRTLPLPNIASAKLNFTEKPEVSFAVKTMKLPLMKVPFIKSCIHKSLMDQICKVLVEPASWQFYGVKFGHQEKQNIKDSRFLHRSLSHPTKPRKRHK